MFTQKIKSILKTPEIWIFLFFIIISAFFYPSILHPDSLISGGGGDDFGKIYEMWWYKYSTANSLDFNYQSRVNFPYSVGPFRNLHPFLNSIIFHGLLPFLNEIAAYNLINWISFPLSAIGMYFLVLYITKNRMASMISGIIFMFSPYHFIRASGHMPLAHIEWIPFFILYLLKLIKEWGYKNAILTGVFLSLVFLMDAHYIVFSVIFIILFIIIYLFVINNSHGIQKLKFFLLAGGIAIFISSLFLLPVFILQLKDIPDFAGARPIGDLYYWQGTLRHYLLPNPENYLLGDFSKKIWSWFGTPLPDAERFNYLGWPGILLAGYGVWRWWRERRGSRLASLARTVNKSPAFAGTPRQLYFDFVMILFIVTAIFAVIFSFSPPLSPSKWIYKILPQFRVYARFFVFVSLAVSVLAGVGLKYLFEWIKNYRLQSELRENNRRCSRLASLARTIIANIPANRLKFYIFVLILITVLVDFVPSFKTTDVSKVPPEYVWLKNQPKEMFSIQHQNQINPSLTLPLQKGENQFGTGQASSNSNVPIVIAEYPYVNSNYGPTPTYIFWQRIHQKPMINGQPEPDPTGKEKIRGLIYDVTNPRTPRILKKLGATYLILHKDQYNQGTPIPVEKKLPKKVKMAEINPGLKLVQRFGLTYVYEIE